MPPIPREPALTVIAAVVPKPASQEDHEQQDDQNQFHRSVFHQCRRQSVPSGVWQPSTGADRAGCGMAA
jgi:hypothetical protein